MNTNLKCDSCFFILYINIVLVTISTYTITKLQKIKKFVVNKMKEDF